MTPTSRSSPRSTRHARAVGTPGATGVPTTSTHRAGRLRLPLILLTLRKVRGMLGLSCYSASPVGDRGDPSSLCDRHPHRQICAVGLKEEHRLTTYHPLAILRTTPALLGLFSLVTPAPRLGSTASPCRSARPPGTRKPPRPSQTPSPPSAKPSDPSPFSRRCRPPTMSSKSRAPSSTGSPIPRRLPPERPAIWTKPGSACTTKKVLRRGSAAPAAFNG